MFWYKICIPFTLRGCCTEFREGFSKSGTDNITVKRFLKFNQVFDKAGGRKSIRILAADLLLWILRNGRGWLCPLAILKYDWESSTFLSENVVLEFEAFIIRLLLVLFRVAFPFIGVFFLGNEGSCGNWPGEANRNVGLDMAQHRASHNPQTYIMRSVLRSLDGRFQARALWKSFFGPDRPVRIRENILFTNHSDDVSIFFEHVHELDSLFERFHITLGKLLYFTVFQLQVINTVKVRMNLRVKLLELLSR